MRKRKLFFWLIVLLLALAFLFFFCRGDLTIAGHTTVVQAEMYVNGELLDMPAIMYWYGDPDLGGALISIPLYSTLEGLGCQIEREEQNDSSSTTGEYPSVTVRVGSRVFVIKEKSYSSDLYENDRQIYFDMGFREEFGSRKVKGQLYLGNSEYKKVLKYFGFDQITCEIDEEARIIRLNAEIDGQ